MNQTRQKLTKTNEAERGKYRKKNFFFFFEQYFSTLNKINYKLFEFNREKSTHRDIK